MMRRRDFLIIAAGMPGIGTISSRFKGPGKAPAVSKVVVKVLGTAQDGGIPQLGCSCPHCVRARRDPKERRLIASLAIADLEQGKFFLIDATPDIRAQAESALALFRPAEPGFLEALGGVVLTHAHIGHYTGLIFFGYESVSAKKMPVYASPRMADFLTNNGPWSQLVRLENIELRALTAGKRLALSERVQIIPFLVPHRDEYTDTLGIRINGPRKSLLYIPDIQSWTAWDRPLQAEVKNADFTLLDGTFFVPEELPGRDAGAIGHPPLRDTIRLLQELSHVKRAGVFFTHFNHTNRALDQAGAARREVEYAGFRLAFDGQEFAL